MNEIKEVASPQKQFRHLPYFVPMMAFPPEEMLCWGTATHKYPTSLALQLERYRNWMEKLGQPNGSHANRLIWMVRAERNAAEHWHLHFIIGRHKVTTGRIHQFTEDQACKFLSNTWPHGLTDIQIYDADPSHGALGYVLKVVRREAEDDYVEFSPPLMTWLKTQRRAAA